jgi:hypothetical protein
MTETVSSQTRVRWPAAILTDAHFWIPIAVLVFGLVVLSKIS